MLVGKLHLVALASAMAMLMAPLAGAGTPTPAGPAGMDCLMVDTDTCTNGGYASTSGVYALAAGGVFQGAFSASVSGGGNTRTMSCSGDLAGAVMVTGTCTFTGFWPPAGAALTLTCGSSGVGAVACSVRGA